MTTGIDLDAWRPEWQRWARERLSLDPQRSEAEQRRAVWAALGEMNFLPPAGWDSALRVSGLDGRPPAPPGPVYEPAQRAWEEALRVEIDHFAESYFELSPADRRRQWQKLAERCAPWPPLATRLEDLQSALDLDPRPPARASALELELVRVLKQIYVMPRPQRAMRRQFFLARCREASEPWQKAAEQLKRQCPAAAVLEPALVGSLTNWKRRERQQEKVQRLRLRKRPMVVKANGNSRSMWWVAVLIGLGMIRLLSSLHNSSPPRTRTPSQYSVPTHDELRQKLNSPQMKRSFELFREQPRRQPGSPKAPSPILPELQGIPIPDQRGNDGDGVSPRNPFFIGPPRSGRPRSAPREPADAGEIMRRL